MSFKHVRPLNFMFYVLFGFYSVSVLIRFSG